MESYGHLRGILVDFGQSYHHSHWSLSNHAIMVANCEKRFPCFHVKFIEKFPNFKELSRNLVPWISVSKLLVMF